MMVGLQRESVYEGGFSGSCPQLIVDPNQISDPQQECRPQIPALMCLCVSLPLLFHAHALMRLSRVAVCDYESGASPRASLRALNPLNVAWILVAAFSTSGSFRSMSICVSEREERRVRVDLSAGHVLCVAKASLR